jgi:hypothetical protein
MKMSVRIGCKWETWWPHDREARWDLVVVHVEKARTMGLPTEYQNCGVNEYDVKINSCEGVATPKWQGGTIGQLRKKRWWILTHWVDGLGANWALSKVSRFCPPKMVATVDHDVRISRKSHEVEENDRTMQWTSRTPIDKLNQTTLRNSFWPQWYFRAFLA